MPKYKKASTVLRKCAELLRSEGRWTQGVDARNEHGNAVVETDAEAVCWCATGAVFKVLPMPPGASFFSSSFDLHRRTLGYLAKATALGGIYQIASWNDQPHRTQAEVVAAFERAAEAAALEGR
jgi:hypothetical protein